MYFDFWYGSTLKDVKGISIFFYPNLGEYRGNMYNELNQAIGDFSGTDSVEIERVFSAIINQTDSECVI